MRVSMNISLPGAMKTWVDEQVEAGGYGTVSEFFRELVREAKKRRVQEEIDRKKGHEQRQSPFPDEFDFHKPSVGRHIGSR